MPFGISAALLTPFDNSGAVDTALLARHAAALIGRGLAGVTPFGTTGEGSAVTSEERMATLTAFHDVGVPMAGVTLGLAVCAVGDALSQAHAAHEHGVRTLLLPPPFYLPSPDTEGVFTWHAEVLAGLPEGMAVVLYHIPQVTGVPMSADIVGRLHTVFPDRVRAIKDSSGEFASARAFLALDGPDVLIGDERQLAAAAAEGASGAISGMANLYPERMVSLFGTQTADLELNAEVDAILMHPVVPALKTIMAARNGSQWARLRAPLTALSDSAQDTLLNSNAAQS